MPGHVFGEKKSFFHQWIRKGDAVWITFSLTSLEFKSKAVKEMTKDPKGKNESGLMKVIKKGDYLARQRLEFLEEFSKQFDTYTDAVSFLKSNIPATNPVTISLKNELKFYYPMTLVEKAKYAFITSISSVLEIGSSLLDFGTDVKVSLSPYTTECCQYEVHNLLNWKSNNPSPLSNETSCSFPNETSTDMPIFCNLSECSLAVGMVPYFSVLSLICTFLPWILGLLIVLSSRNKYKELLYPGSENRWGWQWLQMVIFWIALLFFPITIFTMLAYYQYQLKKMNRTRAPEEETKIEVCERRVGFLAQEGCMAAKAVEVATEASLGPILQLFALVCSCHFFDNIGMIFTNPKEVISSELTLSVITSLLTFAWSMTFHHVTKEGSIDITIHLLPRLVLFTSFLAQITNRLFTIVIFGHQVFGSAGFSSLFFCVFGHIALMMMFNMYFSDLPLLRNWLKWRYWTEMAINSFGCLFVHNNIACFHELEEDQKEKLILKKDIPLFYALSENHPKNISKLRVHRPSLARQLAFEMIILVEFTLMLVAITTTDNKDSLINDDVKMKRSQILSISSIFYMVSLVLKIVYYYLHPWPLGFPTQAIQSCMNATTNSKCCCKKNSQDGAKLQGKMRFKRQVEIPLADLPPSGWLAT